MININSPLYQYIQYLANLREGFPPTIKEELYYRSNLTPEQVSYAKDLVDRTH